MKNWTWVFSIVLGTIAAVSANAQLDGQPPLHLLPKGATLIENSYSYGYSTSEFDYNQTLKKLTSTYHENIYRLNIGHGVTRYLSLFMDIPFQVSYLKTDRTATLTGLADSSATAVFRLFEIPTHQIYTALEAGYQLPTANPLASLSNNNLMLAGGYEAIKVKIKVLKELPHHLLFFNIGYIYRIPDFSFHLVREGNPPFTYFVAPGNTIFADIKWQTSLTPTANFNIETSILKTFIQQKSISYNAPLEEQGYTDQTFWLIKPQITTQLNSATLLWATLYLTAWGKNTFQNFPISYNKRALNIGLTLIF